MSETKIKLCPLAFSSPEYTAQPCMKEECGWWGRYKQCCIRDIADALIHNMRE